MRKSYHRPVGFRPTEDVSIFLDSHVNHRSKSTWINEACREKIARQKNPKKAICDLARQRNNHVDSLNKINNKINSIAEGFNISEQELDNLIQEGMSESELEPLFNMVSTEPKKEDL